MRRAPGNVPPDGTTEAGPSPSDPLVHGLPRDGKDMDQGLDAGHGPDVAGSRSGMGPDLFDCDGAEAVVETRRLELLTLSLQRRCSAN